MALRVALSALMLALVLQGNQATAEITGLGTDGWYTWQVQAVDELPELCCFAWRSGSVTKKQCDLDGRNGGFSSADDSATSGGSVQMFAFMRNGVATKLRALSASCPVSADSTITDLGQIEADASVAWRRQFAHGTADQDMGVPGAIAVHRGQFAHNVLLEFAQPGNDKEFREDAIFWMGQVRIGETADELKNFVLNDENAEIREHAAFSYSQSSAPDIAQLLIQQGKDDKDPDVRSQAWFWLAQTEADESEAAIFDAIANDADEEVREEAVFALSQLPEARSVKALGSLLGNRKMSIDVRENALFWLAQMESDEAFDYIDRLLSDN